MNEAKPVANSTRDRRRWMIASALTASGALLAGLGLAWRSRQPQSTRSTAETALWQLVFLQSNGQSLALKSLRGKPLLLNFWAPWCAPCVEELPLLSRFYREHSARGWQVLGLAIDQPEPVQRFLSQTPVSFPVLLAGLPGVELSRSLGNRSGALPFTVMFGPDGRLARQKMGQMSADDLRAWALLV